MVKLTTVASALGSVKDLTRVRAEFDSADHKLSAEQSFPPDDIRPTGSNATTVLVHITAEVGAAPAESDILALLHVPAQADFAALLVLNPNAAIEAGHTLADLSADGGLPVTVAIVEDRLGVRVDDIIELPATAIAAIIDEIGPLPVSSGIEFDAAGTSITTGTNTVDGASAIAFASTNPVDDAGQTRTRNQRSLLRALLAALRQGKVVRDPGLATAVLGHLSAEAHTSESLSSSALVSLAKKLRPLGADDLVTVVVPATSTRSDDGSVSVEFDAEALTGLQDGLAGGDLAGLVRHFVSLGY